MQEKYYTPGFKLSAFHCPNCGVYSNQTWSNVYTTAKIGFLNLEDMQFAFCTHCDEKSIWLNERMIEPTIGAVPLPNSDLPEEIIEDYREARDILNKSPRGAAALLRLCVQKLCKHLGESGKDINGDIGKLVQKGLPLKVQQALDFVRVVGNDAVHPGQLDLKDDQETATTLFRLLNIIAEVMISQPKHIASLYESLPEGKLKGIEQRDKR